MSALCRQKFKAKWDRGERYAHYAPWDRVSIPRGLSKTESPQG
jgi:hypothetical protein